MVATIAIIAGAARTPRLRRDYSHSNPSAAHDFVMLSVILSEAKDLCKTSAPCTTPNARKAAQHNRPKNFV